MKAIAYLRVSNNQRDLNNQKLEILNYANRNGITISEFIEIEISSRKDIKARRIDELLEKLSPGDILVVGCFYIFRGKSPHFSF